MIRTNPKLWNIVKTVVTKNNIGGNSGKWSARKAQISVKLYKKLGGRYIGNKSKNNKLIKWSNEKWDYINCKNTHKSKNKNTRKKCKGRYLPQIVRQHLTSKEKYIENNKKGSKYGKNISYSNSVNKKMHKYKIY
jgi:hypothetical protein